MSLWATPGPPGTRTAPLAEDYRETPLWWDDTTFPALDRIPAPSELPMSSLSAPDSPG